MKKKLSVILILGFVLCSLGNAKATTIFDFKFRNVDDFSQSVSFPGGTPLTFFRDVATPLDPTDNPVVEVTSGPFGITTFHQFNIAGLGVLFPFSFDDSVNLSEALSFGFSTNISLTGVEFVYQANAVNTGFAISIGSSFLTGGNLPAGTPLLAPGGFDTGFLSYTAPVNANGITSNVIGFNPDGGFGLSTGFYVGSLILGDVQEPNVPEPGTLLLLGTGLFGIALFGRRKPAN